jgi:Bacteriophage tail sheath protein
MTRESLLERPGYAYRTPGVYFEWLERTRTVREPRADIAGFVGIAERGPLHQPVRAESWNAFTSVFGGHIAAGYLAYAVEAFFANGGRTCWVVRVADPAVARCAAIELDDESGNPALHLTARSEGSWANRLLVTLTRLGPERFGLTLSLPDGTAEEWPNLNMRPGDPRNVTTVLDEVREGGSRLVTVRARPGAGPPDARSPELRGGMARLTGGVDGLATLTTSHLSGRGSPPSSQWGLLALEDVDEVAMVAMPDAMPKPVIAQPPARPRRPRCADPDSRPLPPPEPPPSTDFPPPFGELELSELQREIVAHCIRLRDRVALLDPPPGLRTAGAAIDWRSGFDSSYAALYFPWVLAPDPLRLAGLLRAVPPSGHVAGVCARTPVHEPPAGNRLENAIALDVEIGDTAHGDLNERGVNALRLYSGRGIRIAGARTLSSDRLWQFLNVRRLVTMIEEAIEESVPWSVFEPNDTALWGELDRVVRAFLDNLWRRGMLDGPTAEDAFFVRCDETTNPPEERDAGRMWCLVGLQPPWPAEFVIVRIGNATGAARGIPDAESADA